MKVGMQDDMSNVKALMTKELQDAGYKMQAYGT